MLVTDSQACVANTTGRETSITGSIAARSALLCSTSLDTSVSRRSSALLAAPNSSVVAEPSTDRRASANCAASVPVKGEGPVTSEDISWARRRLGSSKRGIAASRALSIDSNSVGGHEILRVGGHELAR